MFRVCDICSVFFLTIFFVARVFLCAVFFFLCSFPYVQGVCFSMFLVLFSYVPGELYMFRVLVLSMCCSMFGFLCYGCCFLYVAVCLSMLCHFFYVPCVVLLYAPGAFLFCGLGIIFLSPGCCFVCFGVLFLCSGCFLYSFRFYFHVPGVSYVFRVCICLIRSGCLFSYVAFFSFAYTFWVFLFYVPGVVLYVPGVSFLCSRYFSYDPEAFCMFLFPLCSVFLFVFVGSGCFCTCFLSYAFYVPRIFYMFLVFYLCAPGCFFYVPGVCLSSMFHAFYVPGVFSMFRVSFFYVPGIFPISSVPFCFTRDCCHAPGELFSMVRVFFCVTCVFLVPDLLSLCSGCFFYVPGIVCMFWVFCSMFLVESSDVPGIFSMFRMCVFLCSRCCTFYVWMCFS